MRKSGLGDRGLNMLLSSGRDVQEPAKDGELKQLPVERICRGEYQPRITMEPAGLQELAESIKSQGLIQPVIVRRLDDGRYELIAGERRWRAAQIAGIHEIPALIRRIPDQAVAAMSLIENIQREDLKPLEEAQALSRLIGEFGLTHQQTSESVGRSRSAITNMLRLLDLEPDTKAMLILSIFAAFYHLALGLQVILEDYIANTNIRMFSILGMKLLCFFFAALGIFSVIKIAVGG